MVAERALRFSGVVLFNMVATNEMLAYLNSDVLQV